MNGLHDHLSHALFVQPYVGRREKDLWHAKPLVSQQQHGLVRPRLCLALSLRCAFANFARSVTKRRVC